MMNQTKNQTEALLGIWEVLRRYRWRFIVPAFAVTAGVLGASLLLPRKYKGEATFERRTDMVLAEITNRGVPRTFEDPRASIAKEVAGKVAIDELVDQLVPATTIADKSRIALKRQQLRTEIEHKINVGYDVSSNELDRVKVSFISESPDLARDVVNKLIERYIHRTQAQMERRLKESSDFFRAEADRQRAVIADLEKKVLVFEIEHGELLPESPNSIQSSLAEVQTQLALASLKRDAAETRVRTLRKSLDQTPATTPSIVTGRNPELDRLEKELREARSRLNQYVAVLKMTPKHPDVIALNEQIAQLEAQVKATPQEVVTQTRTADNPKHAELELMLAGATAERESTQKQEDALTQQLTKLNTKAADLFPVRSDYRALTRQIEEAQRQLTFWEDNQRRVEMAMTAENGDRGVQLDFVMPCATLHKPVSPDVVQVIMAAIVLGMVGGTVCVFIAYRTDESITSPQELSEGFELPMLGTVSEIISRQQRRLRRLRRLVLYPVNGLAMASVILLLTGMLYLNLEKPYLYEQFTRDPAGFIQDRVMGHPTAEGKASPETHDVR
jgi:protein tyrosine kinase modulator